MATEPALRRRFRESLLPRVRVLEDALPGLEEGDAEARASVRRIAELVEASAEAAGFPSLVEPATAVLEEEEDDLSEPVQALVAALRDASSEVDEAVGERVLVVEDDVEVTHLVEVVLGSKGYTVDTARTAAEGRSRVEGATPDLVVLDLILPDQDGRKLLVDLREKPATATVPVMILSARTGRGIREECLALGADLYKEKPVGVEELVETVDTLLRSAAGEERDALRDPVSGLLNRAGIREAYRESGDDGMAVVVLEIDGFDEVEQREGSGVAEEALASVGRAVAGAVGESGVFVGRWRGPEYVILLPGDGLEEARAAAEEALDAVRAERLGGADGESFRLTASAGLAREDGDDGFEELLERGRSCLERARDEGGNRVADRSQYDGGEEPPSILVAEDDAVTAKLLVHRLEREGYDVTLFENGADAYDAALDEIRDLVILDANMPGMGGFELLARLRKVAAYRGTPIILLTAMGREEDLVRGFDLGADDYILKPFSPTELAARVRRLLSARTGG